MAASGQVQSTHCMICKAVPADCCGSSCVLLTKYLLPLQRQRAPADS